MTDYKIMTDYTYVMNHIPLHPFAIKSHPNLIPSLPNLPPMFLPFPPFPDTPSLRCSVTHHLLLHHLSPVTCHIVTPPFCRHYSSLSVSVITVLRYFGSLPPPIKYRASSLVMWLDDHHLTSLHSCGEQLLYCSSHLMTSFLVISYS